MQAENGRHYSSSHTKNNAIQRNEEAAHAATRALTIDPKNLEARYARGVARLEQRLLQPAQTGVFSRFSCMYREPTPTCRL
jgi:hypothetical protein